MPHWSRKQFEAPRFAQDAAQWFGVMFSREPEGQRPQVYIRDAELLLFVPDVYGAEVPRLPDWEAAGAPSYGDGFIRAF